MTSAAPLSLPVKDRLSTEQAGQAQMESVNLREFAEEVRASSDLFPIAACVSASLSLLCRAMKQVEPLHRLTDMQDQSDDTTELAHGE